jgi:hypothetical protein
MVRSQARAIAFGAKFLKSNPILFRDVAETHCITNTCSLALELA